MSARSSTERDRHAGRAYARVSAHRAISEVFYHDQARQQRVQEASRRTEQSARSSTVANPATSAGDLLSRRTEQSARSSTADLVGEWMGLTGVSRRTEQSARSSTATLKVASAPVVNPSRRTEQSARSSTDDSGVDQLGQRGVSAHRAISEVFYRPVGGSP